MKHGIFWLAIDWRKGFLPSTSSGGLFSSYAFEKHLIFGISMLCVCVEVRFFRHLKKSCGNSMILVVSFGAGCFKKCVGVVFFVVSGGGS